MTPTATATPGPQACDIRTVPRDNVAVEQVYVPAGSFMMGSEDGRDNEKPPHEVTLDGFWIDRTEVTNAQYAVCVAAGECQPPSESSSDTRESYYGNPEYADYPVIWVSWEDARDFAEWAGGRLPTEAEWEYAARGPDSLVYPWGSNESPSCELLNLTECRSDTAKVGSYPDGASWACALDMAGNVWEWVNDWYDNYEPGSDVNPTGPGIRDYKILRGGAWNGNGQYTRAAYRLYDLPGGRGNSVGFRVVEPLSDPDS
jgi:formylglycine-generating enzyme required for sulfatase activity